MTMYCYICKERGQASTYHVFPKDPKLRAKWLATFRFEETDIMKYTRICGKHFEDTCFYDVNMIRERKMLKKGSIPTLLLHKPKKKLNFSKNANDATVKRLNIVSASEELHLQEDSSIFMLKSSDKCVSEKSHPQEDSSTFVLKLPDKHVSEESHPQEDSSTFVFKPRNKCVPMSVQEEIEEKVINGIELTSDSMKLGVEMSSTKRQESQVKQKKWCPAHISQIDIEHDFDIPRRAKRHFDLAVSKLLLYKHKIVNINPQKQQITKKTERLELLLKKLTDKKMISEQAKRTIQVF